MVGLTAHRSYLSGERSLASDTIWHLKLESVENTAIQQIVCLYTFAQCWKTKPRQTKLLRNPPIGPALKNGMTKVHQDYSKIYE